jgi:hypothetical protein
MEMHVQRLVVVTFSLADLPNVHIEKLEVPHGVTTRLKWHRGGGVARFRSLFQPMSTITKVYWYILNDYYICGKSYK